MSKSHSAPRRSGRQVEPPRRSRQLRRLVFLALPVLVLFIGLVLVRPSAQNDSPEESTVDPSILIRSDSPIAGPADAPVTIVEFLDPECESCRAMAPVVKDVLQQYPNQVRLVVRYFPLHQNSVLAAAVTEAAGQQGKYWEMQELLFTRQPEWGEQREPQMALFTNYALTLGLDIERWTADSANADIQAKIERDRVDGVALGVQGTPTFFINGRQLRMLSADALHAAIQAELN